MASVSCSVFTSLSWAFEPTSDRVEVARAALDGRIDSLLAGIKALIPQTTRVPAKVANKKNPKPIKRKKTKR